MKGWAHKLTCGKTILPPLSCLVLCPWLIVGLFLDSSSWPMIYAQGFTPISSSLSWLLQFIINLNPVVQVLHLCSFYKVVLANPGPLHFQVNIRNSWSVSKKRRGGSSQILIGIALSLHLNLGRNYNIEPSYPWTWYVSPLSRSLISFSNMLQCSVRIFGLIYSEIFQIWMLL